MTCVWSRPLPFYIRDRNYRFAGGLLAEISVTGFYRLAGCTRARVSLPPRRDSVLTPGAVIIVLRFPQDSCT